MKNRYKSILLNLALTAITIMSAVAVGSQVPKWYRAWTGGTKQGDFAVHVANQPYKLTLYGTSTCKYCKEARAYLSANGILFNDVLVDESQADSERFSKLGHDGVPVLVSAKQLIAGFEPKAYDSFLKSM